MIAAELQAATIGSAQGFGWRVVKFQGAGAGLPDLVLNRGTRTIAVVFGTPTAEQRVRLDALTDSGVLAVAWTPEHWSDGTIEHHLRRQPPRWAPR
jgi:hypothetical protein